MQKNYDISLKIYKSLLITSTKKKASQDFSSVVMKGKPQDRNLIHLKSDETFSSMWARAHKVLFSKQKNIKINEVNLVIFRVGCLLKAWIQGHVCRK